MQTGGLHFNEAQLRDSEAQIMREVCRDFQMEPILMPINENEFQKFVRCYC